MTDTSSVSIRMIDLLKQLAKTCELDRSSTAYVIKRFSCEGITFLTKTLPKLSKAVLHSIEVGYFDRTTLTSFAWKGTSLRYFRSWLSRIFCPTSGEILQDPCPTALYNLRQFTEYLYKLALEFSAKDLENAAATFVAVEREISETKLDRPFVERIRRTFETIFPKIANETIEGILSRYRPRTTSGTFSRVNGKCKKERTGSPYLFKQRPQTVWSYPAECAPYKGVFKPYPGIPKPRRLLKDKIRYGLLGNPGRLHEHADTSDVSEVLFVPKDSRGPRTIVREPLKKLSLQMAYFDYLTDSLQKSTNGRIQFEDQEPFRQLAKDSSVSKTNCTLDLKEASDRVDHRVVAVLCRNAPGLRWFASRRTHQTYLSGVGKLTLAKFAGMGSGLTFPTMALLIFLVCYLALIDLRYKHSDAFRSVHVYGDDIIVPTRAYSTCVEYLGRIGFIVNSQKSYHRSHFRESCGGDYFHGVEVNPLRLKLSGAKPVYDRHRKTINLASEAVDELVSHAHLWITDAGNTSMAEFYYSAVEKALQTNLPGIVSAKSPIMGRLDKEPEVHTNSSGTYRRQRFITSSPITLLHPSADQQIHLSGALKASEESIPEPRILNTFDSIRTRADKGRGVIDYKQVPIPYRKRIHRTKVSGMCCVTNY